MKKINKSVKHQARRQRALDRFSLDKSRHDDSAYQTRKAQELEALKSALGV